MLSRFRLFVVIDLLCTVLLWVMPYFDYMWYSDRAISLLDSSGLGAVVSTGPVFYWAHLALWVAASCGLYFFVPAARPAFVVLWVYSSVLALLSGILVYTSIEVVLSNISTVLSGVIIALMYYTPVSGEFHEAS